MNEETILVILMGLFLFLLFLVGIASDAVAVATVPAASRGESVFDVTEIEPGLLRSLTVRERTWS